MPTLYSDGAKHYAKLSGAILGLNKIEDRLYPTNIKEHYHSVGRRHGEQRSVHLVWPYWQYRMCRGHGGK